MLGFSTGTRKQIFFQLLAMVGALKKAPVKPPGGPTGAGCPDADGMGMYIVLRFIDLTPLELGCYTARRCSRPGGFESMAWYPLLCGWLQEAQSPTQAREDVYIAVQAMLEPIVVSRFRRYGLVFYDIDVADCIDKVFDRMERKLAEPMEFKVRLAPRPAEQNLPVVVLLPAVTHISLVVAMEQDSARLGCKAMLRNSNRLVWEEDCPVECYDARSQTLPVQVPANHLRHGHSYALDIYSLETGDRHLDTKEFYVVRVKALHLLRSESLAVIGHHPDLNPLCEYQAELRDAKGIEVAKFLHLSCSEKKTVVVKVPYHQLPHEQDTQMNLWPGESAALAYSSCIRAVRHESLGSRRGYIAQVARIAAYEHFRVTRNVQVRSIEESSVVDGITGIDEGKQRVAVLLAKSVIERLPQRIRTLLLEHEVEGMSWTEVAKRHNISEAKAKQDISRALTHISRAVLAGEPESPKGAVHRFVDWVKETLDDVVPYRAG
jgi:DNA-directed RNA polymerase specialized sigma24 family protein